MLHDKDIREPLFEYLEETYGKIRIIEEKQMGKSRADVVMVTPQELYGIEIKSDADTYARLERQVKDYNQYYDYNYVVVGSSHAGHIEEHVPDFWGIITVEEIEGRVDFYVLRLPKPNPKKNDIKQMSLLWRPELAHIQEKNEMPKYKAESKRFVAEKIRASVAPDLLKKQLCEELFERDYSTIAQTILEFRAQNQRPPKRAKRKYTRKK